MTTNPPDRLAESKARHEQAVRELKQYIDYDESCDDKAWLIAEVERLRSELTELSGRHQGAVRFFDEIQRVMPDAKSELSKFHEDLQACNKRLLADAERWQYVREHPEILEGDWGRLTPLDADAAVDAARRPEK